MNRESRKRKEESSREGHRERLRLRMEHEGWDALKPHEMIELVLYHVVPRQDLSGISRALTEHFGSVGSVFCATAEKLMEVDGMTKTLSDWILTTGELIRAYCDLGVEDGIRLNCCQKIFDFIDTRAPEGEEACLWVIYADFEYDLITYRNIRTSGNWWDPENLRDIVVDAVDTGARYVYFVRFLNEGCRDLGEEEKRHLESVAGMLRAVEVDFVDCVLTGNGEMHSMKAENRLPEL